jgi:hypothetical protein
LGLYIEYEAEVGGAFEDVTQRFRDLSLDVTVNAEEGSTALSNMLFDDPDGNYDFVGWRRIHVYETEEDAALDLIYSGWVGPRDISRGDRHRTAAARVWDLTMADFNSMLEMRVCTGNDWDRPAETDVQRIQFLMTTNEMSRILDDTYINTGSPKNMDAVNYEGQKVRDVIDDCARQSGKNWFVISAHDAVDRGLWYDFSGSTAYSSTLKASNVISDVDNDTTFYMSLDATLERRPDRVYSGAFLTYDGGDVYVENFTTSGIFTRRDAVYNEPNVKSSTKALARANRYNTHAASEEDRINFAMYLPRNRVGHIKAGQRMEIRASHLPGYQSFTWARVLQKKILEVSEGFDQAYLVTITASVEPVTVSCGDLDITQDSGIEFGNTTDELPVSPSNCLQIWVLNIRDAVDSPSSMVPTGFTLAGYGRLTPGSGGGGNEGTVVMAYRVTQPGDTGSVPDEGLGSDRAHILYEFAGVSALTDVATGIDVANASSITTNSVTPLGGSPSLVICAFIKSGAGPAGGNTLPNISISGPATEALGDTGTLASHDQGPTFAIGYQLVASPSGSYDMTATGDSTGFATGPWGYVLAAFN